VTSIYDITNVMSTLHQSFYE